MNNNLTLITAVKADNFDRVLTLLRLKADIEQKDPNPTALNFFERSPVYGATPLFISMISSGKRSTAIMLELLRAEAKYNRTVYYNSEQPKHIPICNSEIFDHLTPNKRALIQIAKAEDALRDITKIINQARENTPRSQTLFKINPEVLQQLYDTPQSEISAAYDNDRQLVTEYLSGLNDGRSLRNINPEEIGVMKTIVSQTIEQKSATESWGQYCNIL